MAPHRKADGYYHSKTSYAISTHVAAAVLCLSGLTAHAETLIYDVSSSFSDGGSVTGTITYNTINGEFIAANLTNSGFSASNGSYNQLGFGEPVSAGYVFSVYDVGDDSADQLNLGYLGILSSDTLTIYVNSLYVFSDHLSATSASVTLQPSSLTPEPSSLVLLSIGLVGAAGVVRRRLE